MVSPVSDKVPRVPSYSGFPPTTRQFRLRGCHPLWLAFPDHSSTNSLSYAGPTTPACYAHRFGLIPFRSPLLWEYSLFLELLRCFSSLGSLLCPMCSGINSKVSTLTGFPHSDIPGYSTCTQFPGTFRSVPRPSSAFDAKASPAHPY